MKPRILTHGGCIDGFCSAFVFKKYFSHLLSDANVEIIQLQPKDMQLGEFAVQPGDIVLDLPQPREKVFFWCDHHLSAKPKNQLPANYYWKLAPSCSGYLLELAFAAGPEPAPQIKAFKEALDIIDDAQYTPEQIQECFYPQISAGASSLVKMHQIAAMFHSKDINLNEEIFKTLLSLELAETPLESKGIWQLKPDMFFRSLLKSYAQWREWVDAYLYVDSGCVIQDDRKVKFSKGVADRFYAYMKYPLASYGLSIKIVDEKEARIGLGSNIFHKERCLVDIGKLCKMAAQRFGTGAGGGHYYVGGATILAENVDEAIQFILAELKKAGH